MKECEDFVEIVILFELEIIFFFCKGNDEIVYCLFELLGYEIEICMVFFDEVYLGWGNSFYCIVCLKVIKCFVDVLIYFYVLILVLDNVKYYWVGSDEVEKLIEKVGDWL